MTRLGGCANTSTTTAIMYAALCLQIPNSWLTANGYPTGGKWTYVDQDVNAAVAYLKSIGVVANSTAQGCASNHAMTAIAYAALCLLIPNSWLTAKGYPVGGAWKFSGQDIQAATDFITSSANASSQGQGGGATGSGGGSAISGISATTMSYVENNFHLSESQIAGNATLVSLLKEWDAVIQTGVVPSSVADELASVIGVTQPAGTGSGSDTSIASAANWFTESTVISGIPNWGVAGGAVAGIVILKKIFG